MPTPTALGSPVPTTTWSTPAHDAVRRLLRAAVAAERSASGADQLRRFRDTRRLIGAARELDLPTAFLAEVLGVRATTVHARTDTSATIAVGRFLGLLPDAVADAARASVLSGARDSEGRPTTDLLRWVAEHAAER